MVNGGFGVLLRLSWEFGGSWLFFTFFPSRDEK